VHREVHKILRGYRVVPCARRGLGERPAKGLRAPVSLQRLPPPSQRRADRPGHPADGRRIGCRIAERHQDRPQFWHVSCNSCCTAQIGAQRGLRNSGRSHTCGPFFCGRHPKLGDPLSQFRTPPVKFGRHPRLGPGLRRRRAAKIRYSSRWVRSSRSWRSCASTLKVAMGRASRRRRLIGSAVSSQ